jgi:Zn-dependent protease
MMKWSLKLGRLAGIPVQVHWTFVLILIWVAYVFGSQGGSMVDIFWGIAFVLTIFFCVVLHELGHALMARRFGVSTHSITLLPIGGVARLDHIPEEPKEELLIAIAGPLVNVVIAIGLFLILGITGNLILPEAPQTAFINPTNFFFKLMAINIFLVIFNAIPAFPMDGGRILRSLLAFKMTHLQATRIAAGFGQGIAILFAIGGLFGNPFLIIIALFVYLGAQGEAHQVRTQSVLKNYKVQDITMQEYTALHPQDSLLKAVKTVLNTQQTGFVITKNNKVKGLLTRDRLMQGLSEKDRNTPVKEIMQTNFPALAPTTPLGNAYQTMMKGSYQLLPVMQNDQLLGILDRENIQEHIQIQEAVEQHALRG